MSAVNYRAIYEEVFGRSPESGLCGAFSDWMAEQMDAPSPVSVLDVGCGRGKLLHILDERGVVVRGFDVGNFVTFGEVRGCVDVGDVTQGLPYDAGQFDIVVCSHVLEHILFREVNRVAAELFRVAGCEVYISLGLADCPEHLSVLPWSQWAALLDEVAATAGWALVRSCHDGLTHQNVLVFEPMDTATEARRYQPRRIKEGYPS